MTFKQYITKRIKFTCYNVSLYIIGYMHHIIFRAFKFYVLFESDLLVLILQAHT